MSGYDAGMCLATAERAQQRSIESLVSNIVVYAQYSVVTSAKYSSIGVVVRSIYTAAPRDAAKYGQEKSRTNSQDM